tara:strand:- start:1928 stop:2737 length:810 start_codon:yes stop_codon:yes gene_type:complete
MRRPFLTAKAIYYIFFAGLFSLLSFFFDQQVIQKEGDVRNIETEIVRLENNFSQSNMLMDSFDGLTERAILRLNEYHMNSSLAYKFIFKINIDRENDRNWSGVNRDQLGEVLSYQFGSRLYNLSYYIGELKTQITTYLWSEEGKMEKPLEDKILETLEVEDEFYDSYMTKLDNDEILSSDEAMQMFDFYYDELFELENIFNLLTEISVTYYEKSLEIEKKVNDRYIVLEEQIKAKNYFILISILMQILSLLFLLLLFRTIIKNIIDNES